jgi:Flp pilus assembly pilin Flp
MGVHALRAGVDAVIVRVTSRQIAAEAGQTMTEYAIVLSLVAVVVIAAVAALGSRISAVLTTVTGLF